ncbi:hypothetical protein [Flagellimonas profundi]|uniref:Bacteriocin n=1 Tax=Flagellimonas profundi TaxID=2915620 RepID=A0ABS3FCK8_9FLAO|nr:hypothetical protein [Allomuricauda profundi]MBO0340899.1 hypothetical protein [Allomuricauda profundi]
MNFKLKELNSKELADINGGGWLYDTYRIVVEEAGDFVKGFKDGLENGLF